jgi:hypothetical protein
MNFEDNKISQPNECVPLPLKHANGWEIKSLDSYSQRQHDKVRQLEARADGFINEH